MFIFYFSKNPVSTLIKGKWGDKGIHKSTWLAEIAQELQTNLRTVLLSQRTAGADLGAK